MTPKIYISGTVDTTLYITELRPSSVSSSVKNIAELIEAVDGSVNYLHRNFKNSWNLSWQLIPKSTTSPIAINTVEQLKTFYYATQYTGTVLWLCFESRETGAITKFNVIPEPNTYSEELAANQVTLTNRAFYNVSFRLIEI
jgi:hypothetical protein